MEELSILYERDFATRVSMLVLRLLGDIALQNTRSSAIGKEMPLLPAGYAGREAPFRQTCGKAEMIEGDWGRGLVRMRHLLSASGAFICLMACSGHMHPYADYLHQSVGREDHDAVVKKMGVPHRTVNLDKGGDLWTYEYCPSASSQCQYVNLIFDKSGTLAEWFED